jgi:hypothetical protein
LFGKAVRLSFHDAGEIDLKIDSDKLGPDGCLSSDRQNSGLVEPETLVTTLFEPIWQTVCDKISRADYWALLGKITLEKADPTQTLRVPYQFGRKDNQQCEDGIGRLPSAQGGVSLVKSLFQTRMGLDMHDAGNSTTIIQKMYLINNDININKKKYSVLL